MPESEFLDRRKIVTYNIVNNFESFKHGNIEESIKVPNCKENMKGDMFRKLCLHVLQRLQLL